MASAADKLSVVVCDDDATTRTAVGVAVAAAGAHVLAETDSARAAVSLIDGFDPDVVIVDLALASGTGRDIIDHVGRRAADRGAVKIIVFSAYSDSVAHLAGPGITVLDKTSFQALEEAISHARTSTTDERRRAHRDVASPTMRHDNGLDDPGEFYAAVANAAPGDALLAVTAVREARDVAVTTRSVLRTSDRVMARRTHVLAVLLNAGQVGADAVGERIRRAEPSATVTAVVVDDTVDPTSAFAQLTA